MLFPDRGKNAARYFTLSLYTKSDDSSRAAAYRR